MTKFEPWVWRVAKLRAWGRPLNEVLVEFQPKPSATHFGCAWPERRRVVIYGAGLRRPEAVVATLVHEFAHCAAPGGEHHGDKFKALLRAGTIELTGLDPGEFDNYETMQRSVEDAVAAWWVTSGMARKWRTAEAFERLGKGRR